MGAGGHITDADELRGHITDADELRGHITDADELRGHITDADELRLIRGWMTRTKDAVVGEASGRLLVLSASRAVVAAAAELGIPHAWLSGVGVDYGDAGSSSRGTAATSWAAKAAACVELASNVSYAEGRPLVLSTPSVAWLRDPSAWVHCEGGAADHLQCAPLGPADAMVGSEMLSVRQDALCKRKRSNPPSPPPSLPLPLPANLACIPFPPNTPTPSTPCTRLLPSSHAVGAAHAKWGAFDPSILVVRSNARGLALRAHGGTSSCTSIAARYAAPPMATTARRGVVAPGSCFAPY